MTEQAVQAELVPEEEQKAHLERKPHTIEQSKPEETAVAKKEDANTPLASYDGFTRMEVNVIQKTCCPTLKNPEDIVAFCKLAKLYKLDPFAKEIWGWEQKGKVCIEASASGWRKMIKRQTEFKRMTLEPWYEEDEIEFDLLNGKVLKHAQSGDPKGTPIGAYCFVEYHDGTSNLSRALWSEYGKSATGKSQYGTYDTPWKYAQEMIKNKAASIFGRTYCGISGLYAEGEVERTVIGHETDEHTTTIPPRLTGKAAKAALRKKKKRK